MDLRNILPCICLCLLSIVQSLRDIALSKKFVIARSVEKTYFLKVSEPIDSAQVYVFIDAIKVLHVC